MVLLWIYFWYRNSCNLKMVKFCSNVNMLVQSWTDKMLNHKESTENNNYYLETRTNQSFLIFCKQGLWGTQIIFILNIYYPLQTKPNRTATFFYNGTQHTTIIQCGIRTWYLLNCRLTIRQADGSFLALKQHIENP